MEVIVAIFIITAGVVGVLSLISQTVGSVTISSQRLTAAYLAQEGIEIVRNIRDTNWLEDVAWDDGLGVSDWEADYDDANLTSCPFPCDYENNLRFLKIDGGFYNYISGTGAEFKRKITISREEYPPGSGRYDKITVTVEVFWQEKGRPHSVPVQENLYNWK